MAALHWDDLDQDQRTEITQIMVHQMKWIHSQGRLVGSFDFLWSVHLESCVPMSFKKPYSEIPNMISSQCEDMRHAFADESTTPLTD